MPALSNNTAIETIARAKINLALHVTGQRADGYHRLDTMVAFPDIGDRLIVEPADTLSLTVEGPFATRLEPNGDNLVLRAARLLAKRASLHCGARIVLEKNLPIASGIGGGSADAAAALRLVMDLWHVDISAAELVALALQIGADVPMCLASSPLIARGIGDEITPIAALPEAGILLVNPGAALSTPQVFKALERRDNASLPALPDVFADATGLGAWLARTRNDLEAPAIALAPIIADVLTELRAQPAALLARMSGSGATCFALFATIEQAQSAARQLAATRETWWIQAARLS